MSFTLAGSAAGLALLAVLAAGCGTAVTAHPAAAKPSAAAHSAAPRPTAHHHHHFPAGARCGHYATRSAGRCARPDHQSLPQGNGGDQDADNNGGPTDGDGNI